MTKNPQSTPETHILRSESEMVDFGRAFAETLEKPAVLELVGDVGTGKTTFTRGLAEGLGITSPITSPSYTLSKRYPLPSTKTSKQAETNTQPKIDAQTKPNERAEGELIHYDFYRLSDPGIMRNELSEALSEPGSVIVVEWGGDVADLLPASKIRLELTLLPDGSRQVTVIKNPKPATPAEPKPDAQTAAAETINGATK